MALTGVIVYFPWGAGGNLVRNIITLDTRFEFLDDKEFLGEYPEQLDRFKWLLEYYNRPMEPELWLPREWSIRRKIHTRYYENGAIKYWNPEQLVVYDIHGAQHEIDAILKNTHLLHHDRTRITSGEVAEQLSQWALRDCEHIFLIPKDVEKITEIYNSKNPTINQLEYGDLELRQREAQVINSGMTSRMSALEQTFATQNINYHNYVADDLYTDAGATVLLDIVDKLHLTIPQEYVRMIHSSWLAGTRTVYKKYFNKELDI